MQGECTINFIIVDDMIVIASCDVGHAPIDQTDEKTLQSQAQTEWQSPPKTLMLS